MKLRTLFVVTAFVLLFALNAQSIQGQSTATLQGTVSDPSGAVVAGAKITVRNQATGVDRVTQTDDNGIYQVAALPVGVYRVEVQARGFGTQAASEVTLQVSQTVVQNFQLKVTDVSQEVTVTGASVGVETTTITVGQVIDQKTVQEIPLNGRHFVDLGLLIPGSVTPPQTGFLTAPLRGQGSFAFNTAGNREDTVNFMINGINLNDQVQNQITFQPSINTVQEFKVDNSTFSAEYGRSSGAIANIATRSGSNSFHGEAFEFLRNEALDARNFFDRTKPPFKRNQYGGALGGPIVKDRAFFFASYEGLRQRQGLTLNSGTLSESQRARVTDPVVRQLLPFIPLPNAVVNGSPRFLGSGTAPVNLDQGTIDVSVNLGDKDRIHGYYAIQQDLRGEPILQQNSIPGFGDTRESRRQIMTINETHTFGPRLVNEARIGYNRIRITFTPNSQENPADFGINNGINQPIGLPQIIIDDIGLNFGGPSGFPQGRADTTVVFSDTLNYLLGRHSMKFGGEYRRFYNNNFNLDTGLFRFGRADDPASAQKLDFLNGNASSFSITLGDRASSIETGALGFFVQDSFKVLPNLTFELGLRYDWNMTPTERYDRFVVFDPATVSLVQVGSDIDRIYKQNNKNFQPRFGFAWDPFKDGKTSVRGAYAILTDQPVTNMVTPTSANPPLATPLAFTGLIRFDNAVTVARGVGLAPNSVDQNFDNAYVQSWNLNIQRELTSRLTFEIGYFGSKGTHLRLSRNINQFINGVRPFPRLSASSPIRPGEILNNITEVGSAGNSSYNALWISGNQRLTKGLQFNASYTWSKSIDYNSLNSQGVVVQDSYNIRNDRGLSAYDARHRFVTNLIYEFPFKGNQLVEGWQVSGIVQLQSGNPVTIVSNLQALTGVANTGRPDLIGTLNVLGRPEKWFDNTVCDPRVSCPAGTVFALPVAANGTFHFGSLGRNVVIGPDFKNVDFSILKNTKITESVRLQFRTEIFDLFNHANFGQPGTIAQPNSTTFGVVTNTRFPTGDSGSSRQIQFALKVIF